MKTYAVILMMFVCDVFEKHFQLGNSGDTLTFGAVIAFVALFLCFAADVKDLFK